MDKENNFGDTQENRNLVRSQAREYIKDVRIKPELPFIFEDWCGVPARIVVQIFREEGYDFAVNFPNHDWNL